MSVWNPLAYGPQAQPSGAVVPPGLRVRGPARASASQILAAQHVFARYCDLQRVSPVPNPTQSGALPDGTRYRITTVGNTTNMEIWPTGDEEPVLRGGIGLVLVNLDGSVLPAHTLPNKVDPQPYIITPGIQPDRLTSTGEWSIRRVPELLGGKIVHRFAGTDEYLTGVDGRQEWSALPPERGWEMWTGLQARALKWGYMGERTPVYSYGKLVLRSTEFGDMLPFYRKDARRRNWVMRVNVNTTELRLYGALAPIPPGEQITDLLHTLDLPHSINFDSCTVNQAGTRIMLTMGGPTSLNKVVIGVGERTLSIVSVSPVEAPQIRTDVRVENLENASAQGSNQYDAFCDINFPAWSSYTTRDRITTLEWSEQGPSTSVWGGFNIKGTTKYIHESINYKKTLVEDFYVFSKNTHAARFPAWPPNSCSASAPYYVTTRVDSANTTTSRTTYEPGRIGGGATSLETSGWTEYRDREQPSDSGNSKTGLRESWFTGFAGAIFYDELHDIRVEIVTRHDSYWPVNDPSPVDRTQWALSMTQGQVEFMRVTLEESRADIRTFACTAANDPLTGVLCFNVVQFAETLRKTAVRSWIFVVDALGVRPLSSIMDIPAGSSVRVRKDSELLCI